MKSYFLEGIRTRSAGVDALQNQLPGQQQPWVLYSLGGDSIAYFNIYEEEGRFGISADISGRYFNEDDAILAILRALRATVEGVIYDDFDAAL